MEIFLVGGAIRDMLLGIPIKDRDWVVVGATPKQMIDAGYQQVGHNFPVFLHPQSHEEYALARTERKCGFGYTGFISYSSPDVTLEQDLQRRDLTINALAQDNKGKIIDILGGMVDLRNRILHHISSSFSEDPLRVLRVARFAACYAHLGFYIANETMKLMCKIVKSGELAYLTKELIWKETKIALSAYKPQIYFQILRDCGALRELFPEINLLFGIPTTVGWSLEKNLKEDTGIHALTSLGVAAKSSSKINVRFATLCHDIGKSLTPKQFWPYHYNHDLFGVKLIEQICHRLRVPNEIRDLAKLSARFHELIHVIQNLRPVDIVKLFYNIDAWRKPERIEQIVLISEFDIRGYTNLENCNYSQGHFFYEAWRIINLVSIEKLIKTGFKGIEINKELMRRRIQAITNWKENKYRIHNKYSSSSRLKGI